MKDSSSLHAASAVALLITIGTTPAFSAQRTFVASFGNEANACTIAAPCRSFARAMTQTDAEGEIIVLDSAGYGPVTIDQSVSIVAPAGVYGGISVFTGSGITIDGPLIKVVLRGLSINGQGLPTAGISFVQGSTLYVDRCIVSNMSGNGLKTDATGSELFVNDSTFRDNNLFGVLIEAGAATLDRVHSENNDTGIRVDPSGVAAVQVLIRDSVSTGNGTAGFVAFTDAFETARVAITNSTAFRNGSSGPFSGFSASGSGTTTLTVSHSEAFENSANGISAFGTGTTVIVSGNTFSRNLGVGMRQSSFAVLRTMQNNVVEENVGGATAGTITNANLQ